MVMGGGGGEKKLSEEDEDIQTSSWKVNESHIWNVQNTVNQVIFLYGDIS